MVPMPNIFPKTCPQIAPSTTPAELALRLRGLDGLVFLDSSSDQGELSILAAEPSAIIRGNIHSARARAALRDHLNPTDRVADLGLPAGGLFGSIDFDGAFTFGRYDDYFVYQHEGGQWFQVGDGLPINDGDKTCPIIAELGDFEPTTERGRYIEMVERAKEYIAAGDIYQVNLAQKFRTAWNPKDDAFGLYLKLRETSPAPHSAFLDLDGRQVLSSSPETFLKISGNLIQTRPIKGTRPRFRDAELDEKAAYELRTCTKENAELIMITDLERNDLGQVSEYGSVQAIELLKLERFAQVFHLVSTVQGTLLPEVDHVEALWKCYPGGSISGAPKKRALEIIAELEAEPRGLYTGAIGYLGDNGESQFNIAIRTAIAEDNEISFHVGAGIVADSVPAKEYEETLHKAAGLLEAVRR
ncbi:MAG: para-aminobenzoate synthetase component 1 [Pseudoalteromonas tetraodonis]|jgi:para-aminobenzoate synthetase component 1